VGSEETVGSGCVVGATSLVAVGAIVAIGARVGGAAGASVAIGSAVGAVAGAIVGEVGCWFVQDTSRVASRSRHNRRMGFLSIVILYGEQRIKREIGTAFCAVNP